MERKISLSDLRKAVDEAYEANKSTNEGEIDPRNACADPKAFGISVMLPDGTLINKGDTDVKSPLGSISKVALSTVLFSQNSPMELIKKSGQCACHKVHCKPKGLSFSAHGIRAFSALEPVGDPESKWNIYENRMIDLMGSSPALCDKTLQTLQKEAADTKLEDTLAADGYYLYDNAALSINLYLKALAMNASTQQLATMGATIAADGVNPVTGKTVFDGAITQNIVALMAAKGPHKMRAPWLVAAGIPAKSSYGGAILGIIPGVMAIAAYSPALNPAGVSVKASKAIIDVMQKLDISIFASAKVKFVND
ncbi:glutaminase [uncultured Muribaculum sp.]|jgi:glutaminase|uniref:glutaminase n=1 Tax=uncultured Muribaculum sp. TaxID=1918613 RepID=UPI0025A66A49|nr:glutaminase [uncultured Muribaculum sp.]